MSLTGRTGLLALLGVPIVALLFPSWLGIGLVAAVLLVGVLFDLLLAGPVRALELHRSGDRFGRLGADLTVTLTVRNPGTRPVVGTLRDAWPPSAGVAVDRHRINVPAGEQRSVVTQLNPTRRGDRHADRVTVRSIGPLGLAARQGSHGIPWSVRVLPPFDARKHLPARLAQLRELDGRQAARVRGQGTEFDSLREYVFGDDVRSIDWRATARSSAGVVVRTWRPERDRHLIVVLDTGRTSAGRVGTGTRLDTAMDAALLLAVLAGYAGDRVDLLAFDRQVRAGAHATATATILPSFVDAMANLEPSLVETDARAMIAEILRRAPRRSLVVLLTGLDAAPLEQTLIPVLPMLSTRHRLLIAAVADPRIEEMRHARGDAGSVYDAASAERALAERTRVAALLARHGVEVVDAVPDQLAPALADRYLALKAAGKL